MPEEIPKFNETFLNILSVLSGGEVMEYRKMRERVKKEFYSDLPEDLLSQKTKSGGLLIDNRIGWGKTYLKEGGFVTYPQRAMVQITKKGVDAYKKGRLSLDDLKNDVDYIECQRLKVRDAKDSVIDEDFQDASPQDLIDRGFRAIENDVRIELKERYKDIDPYYFEKIILILLKKMGYGEFVETKKSGDGGIDGIINQDQLGLEKIYIQAKRYREAKVREKDIRNFIGAMSGDTSKGVFVTTSEFDESAMQKAREAHHNIVLIDGEKLASLMYEYGVGVQVQDFYEVKMIDQDFFE